MSFNKEDKYLVINRKDIESSLTPDQQELLQYLTTICEGGRKLRGKTPLECVVVESTSTNYEKVWEMIEEEYSTKEK